MPARTHFLILVTLAAFSWTGVTHAADEISRIPRIGLKTVMRVASDGLCGRISEALVAREKIDAGQGDAAEGILIVRPVRLELFPKRFHSVRELFELLSAKVPPCKGLGRDGRLIIADHALGANGELRPTVLVYEKKPDGSALRVLKYVLDYCLNLKRGVFCSGPVFEPGYLNVEFTRGSIRSGLEQLKKDFGLTPHRSHRPVLSPEQESIFNQDPDSTLLPSDFSVQYLFRIEPRQEEPWAFILNRLPYVEDAAREPVMFAAVNAARAAQEREYEKVNQLPRSALANAAIPIPNAQVRSLTFLSQWFGTRGGVVTVVERDDNLLRVRIDRLVGEVIRQEKFWEYLKLNLIVIEDQRQTKLYLMNDGYYAPGVGNRVPPDSSFKSMEQNYYRDLTEYTDALATQIQDHVRRQP
jgi:hypothetical protein